jgi:predicted metal-dependent hydrolase
MNSTTLPTPADLSITPRDRKFGREHATPRLWHGGRVEATAIYNALSTTFPVGEAFFVESVRKFREGASPKLAEEIKAFTTQEAIHSREHDAFNRRAADAGYDLSKLEAQVNYRLGVTRSETTDRQPGGDNGARTFHRHPGAPAARQSAPPWRR